MINKHDGILQSGIKKTVVAVVLLVLAACCTFGECRQEPMPDFYGDIGAERYLTGRFSPPASALFVELSALGIPTDGRPQYLRREAAGALLRMYRAFRISHPKVPFRIRSSTRTWYDQKSIWEDKWNGKTPVEGKKLNVEYRDPRKRAHVILRYSSMPGTSRHHWGTDFDLNELINSYYSAGEGAVFYAWLVKNAAAYGFCQPYTEGRNAGYEEERWHWSYVPLARTFLKDWMAVFSGEPGLLYKDESFEGAAVISDEAPLFVESINPACGK